MTSNSANQKVQDIQKRLAALSPEKRAILEKKLKQQNKQAPTKYRKIPKASNRDSGPLSFSQQRIWFLKQLEPNSYAYNIPRAWKIVGDLNIAALEQALTTIVDRHGSLRTVFSEVDGKPLQVINRPTAFSLAVVETNAWSTDGGDQAIQNYIETYARQPFDLSSDLMLRGTILRRSEREHFLILVLHHMAFDGWSMGVFKRELSQLYDSLSQGKAPSLPPLQLQYLDFAHWQREQLAGDTLQRQIEYWKNELCGAPALLNLPTDRPRPAIQTFVGDKTRFQISPALTAAIRRFGQESGATPFMVLLSALSILLSRYSGQEDVMVGSPIANRNQAETEPLIGFFVNTLVLRNRLQGNPTFAELVARVKKSTLEAYDHKDVPFEELAAALQPERDPSHSLWFQVLFTLHNTPTKSLEFADLEVSSVELNNQRAKFDLTISLTEAPSSLEGILSYNTDLFDRGTIERMLGHWQRLLEAAIANPQRCILELPLLTPSEQQQLLEAWPQDAHLPLPQGALIHQQFEAQATTTPNAVAVATATRPPSHLTYAELNDRANQLAHYLQRLGVGPETLVGVCIERSPEMVVATLGVLKAGGAYVPLDPHYPADRLAFMLEDSQAQVLLTQSLWQASLPEHGEVVCLDRDWPAIAQCPKQPPQSDVTAENLAYVIYTSGSTGKPKGVMVQHSSLLNFTESARQAYQITEGDRVLQFASISFDAAAEEIYPCLTAGGTLVLRNEDMLSSVAQFLDTCQAHRLTVLDLPTAYWQQIVIEMASQGITLPDTLRLVIIGGERVSPEHVKSWQRQVGDCPRLVNTYGPTEGTVVATAFAITSKTSIVGEVPIGKAIGNVETYVVDSNTQPVPIGVPGELLIGGSCLARGYLNRPELTQERFIAHPFKPDSQERLYRTGDLVRYLANGNIEYLGRIDDQVKIRGFRIELGEIETALNQHPAVQQGVVIAREDTPGDKRLVAYWTSDVDEAPQKSQLRQFLRQTLPDYMVPSLFVRLDELPLTPNKKVNRRALPQPDVNQLAGDKTFAAPRTPVEEKLAQIWCDVLKLERVSIHDSFFELGGHSLLAVQVIARLKRAFEVEISLRHLFDAPRISELASLVEILQSSLQAAQASSSDQDSGDREVIEF